MSKPRHIGKNRWGRLDELDRRIRVGTQTFDRLPFRLRQLTAWRGMHAVSPSAKPHSSVRMYGTRKKVRPSSNLPLKLKVAYVLKRGKDKRKK